MVNTGTVSIRGHELYEVLFSRLLSVLTQIGIWTSLRPRRLFVWDLGMIFWYILSKSTDRYSGNALPYITHTEGKRIM